MALPVRPSVNGIRPAALLTVLTLACVAIGSLGVGPSLALTNGGSITALDSPLTENFDSLGIAGGTWVDNTTIPGWYSTRAAYVAGTGSSNTGALYSFGVAGTNPVTDRALGSVASGGTGTVYQAARLTNSTGATITSLDISYAGEQWRNGGNVTAHTLAFQYQVANPGAVTSANVPATGWTTHAPLSFTGPVATATAAALDGNAESNRIAIAATLTITVNPGQEIWLRWQDPDDAGSDHGLAIDDFSVVAHGVPGDNAPTVTATTPADSATNVPVASTIAIAFSESVTATASAFSIQCPLSVPQSFSQSASPAGSFTLVPASPLPANTTCTVTVAAAQITDADLSDPPNGMTGDFSFSFTTASPTPPVATNVIINEVDADTPGTDVAEFVELYDGGTGGTSLTGLVLVFFNGSNDQSYAAFDLDGFSTNAQGYFTIGNSGVPGAILVFGGNLLQNGADAVALFAGNATDFPNGTLVSATNLRDAMVYGTDDADDSGLLVLLNAGQPQVNESGGGSGDTQSSGRCPNGAGGARNTAAYQQAVPSPNAANTCAPPPQPSNSPVVISQVYGGGGNAGSTFLNDFVELYNRGSQPTDLTGWSLQYASATGSGWGSNLQPLGGTIAPGEYLLVSLGSGNQDGAALPVAPNITGLINMSATSGKIALTNSFDELIGNCPIGDAHLMDLVGYGAADCREGPTTAPGGSNTTSVLRLGGGAADTDRNGSDFISSAPNPRRTAPVVELGPLVLMSDPRKNGLNAPRDATVVITFTEAVDVFGAWFDITCAMSGQHNSATFAGGGQTHYITPNVDFIAGETCTVTLFKAQIHDQDLDDAGQNTDTLPADHVFSFSVSTGTPPPYAPAEHLTMGNPTSATPDLANPTNFLMQKPEYALSYNRDLGRPNWVSWHLSDDWVGTLERVDTFRPDPRVPPDWYRVQAFDFGNSGFDRGHMVPNADRDKETSIPINQATFLMSNMLAQAPDNNQGPWAALENYLRTLLPSDEVYIVAGGAGTGGTGSQGPATTIANGHVTVPSATWKVALVIPKGFSDVSRVSCSSRTIAVIMPNTQGIRNDPWEKYLTTVDAVEALTGYNLFSELPQAIQACVEAGINGNNPALDQTPPTISCSAPDGVWHAANVSQACTASDAGGSGLVNPNDASFLLSTSVPAGVETANASTGSRVVCDVAGNCATAGPIAGNKIDRKAPVITITSPTAQTYVVGQSVTASYTCVDVGSGSNTCAGPVASGQAISTSAPGAGVFTVTASDAAGNTASQSVSYSVGYNICALYDQTKAHKAGSTVPIRLQVCNHSGASVSSPALSVVATGVVLVATNAPGVLEDSGKANPDNQFRFTGDAYVFNLSTKNLAAGTYALIFRVGGDSTPHMVQFQVR